MRKAAVLTLAVVFIFSLYVNGVLAVNNDDFTVDAKRKDGDKKYSPLWFGPRIGRRKRNPAEDMLRNLDRDEIETLVEAVRNSPWAPASFNSPKRYSTMGFTPRLGRESGEDVEEADFGDFISQRSPPFAPRLGRHLSPYSPRLGRENELVLQS